MTVIGLAFRFDLGRYHANPWGQHVNDAAIEWPPSPWRVLRALYSVARTNVQLHDRRTAVDAALRALIAAPPPVFELPPATPAHTRHYMPERDYSALRPASTAKVIDGFIAVDPESELRIWWDVALTAEQADALAATAKRIGHLGRSESVCTASLVAGQGPRGPVARPAADAEGEAVDLVELLCLDPDSPLDSLAVSVTDLRKRRRLVPPDTRRLSYALPSREPAPQRYVAPAGSTRSTLALLRLGGSQRPALTDAVAVGQALRAALQHHYGRANRGAASATLSGRAGARRREDQHRHAHYLALPDGHGRRIDRLIVWAPEGLGPPEVAALAALSFLAMHGIPDQMPVALAALGDDTQLALPDVLGPSRCFRSLTPFGLVRHPKFRRGQLVDSPVDQVRRELSQRALPMPETVELLKGSWHRFRSAKAGTSRLEQASAIGVRLRFPEAVRGPLAIGALSHYGLGLLVPEH